MELSMQLFVVFFSLMITVSAKEKVPVLVWTNDDSVVFPQQLAGHSINQQGFRKSFVDDLASNLKDNVVLFMQDKLTVTDFTRFADIYGADEEKDSFSNIKSLMSEMTSTFLPSVASPSSALLELKHQTSRKIHTVDDPEDLSLDTEDGPQLIVVRLPELRHSQKSVGHLDKIVGLVTAKLKALSRPFIAYYTASTPVHQGSSVKSHHHHSRRLMSVGDDNSGIFVNVSDSFYLYSKNISLVSASGDNRTVLADIEVVDEKTECNDTGDNCLIVLKFQSMPSLPVNGPALRMQFNRTTGINTGYWYLSSFVLYYYNSSSYENATADPSSNDVTIEYSTSFVAQTPFGFSYHCNKLLNLVVKNATGIDAANAPMIDLDSFQMQAFVIQNSQFGHYNDCIGFFTIGIWMFLITAAVLLAVLFFGIIMVMNLTTMDRFDEAKGKTITVAVGD